MGSLGAHTHSTHSHTQLTLPYFAVTAIGCSLFPLGLVVLVSLIIPLSTGVGMKYVKSVKISRRLIVTGRVVAHLEPVSAVRFLFWQTQWCWEMQAVFKLIFDS